MSKAASWSQALAESWAEMLVGLEARSTLKPETPRLTDYAFGRFDPKVVIERLLEPEPSYFALKDILFAGLCVWTVCPNSSHLIDDAMVLSGISRMAELEEHRKAQLPQDAFLADIVARLAGPGIDFYRDFYYPIGGLRRILNVQSPELLWQAVSKASDDIGFEVEIMRVCHYHALHLRDTDRYKISSNKGAGRAVSNLYQKSLKSPNIVNEILRENRTSTTQDPLNCQKKAAPFKSSAVLIYAASSILVGSQSFLQKMRAGNVNYREHKSLLMPWLSRAVYAAETIIEPMYPSISKASQIDFLPNIPKASIGPPEFGEESDAIHKAFDIRSRI